MITLNIINSINNSLYVLIMSHIAFKSESTLYSCLSVKELLTRNRREISSLSDCNGIRNHNHLVRKRTINHSAKLTYSINNIRVNYKQRH